MAMEKMMEEDVSGDVDIVGFHLRNSEALRSLDDQLGHLPSEWKSDFKALRAEFSFLLQDIPGRTTLTVHDVGVGNCVTIKQRPYRLAVSNLENLRQELAYML